VIQLEEFYNLRELLKDFMPLISRIDKNVDKMYRDIEGEYERDPRDGI